MNAFSTSMKLNENRLTDLVGVDEQSFEFQVVIPV